MGLYALAQRTTNGVAGAAAWEVRSSAGVKPKVMEIGVSQVTAVAGVFGIGRPAAIGITPTSPQTFVDEGDGGTVHGTFGPAGSTVAAVAWATPPTVPTNFNRRLSCAATVGVGAIFTFPRGLGLPVSSSFVVWVIATAPVCDVWAVVEE